MTTKNYVRLLILVVFILLVIGVVMVMTASSFYSNIRYDNTYKLFGTHLSKIMIALIFMAGFSFIPYEFYKKHSKKIILGIFVLLILTIFTAAKVKGAGRWLNIGFFSFQPSEIAKIALIIHLAYLIDSKGEKIKDFKNGAIFLFAWIIIIVGLIMSQPNFSTGIIILITSFTILFIAGVRLKHLFFTSIFTAAAAGIGIFMIDYARNRILSFLSGVSNETSINTQVLQAQIALGSGGIFGLGIGNSRQSNLFLPEAYGDFIFSILGEETGFLGTVVVLTLYLSIFVLGFLIAKNTQDKFGQILAFGISFLIVLSAFINSAVVIGLVPTTGITLPFISYGGTSIIFLCAAVGILINIGIRSQNYIQPEMKYS